MKLVIGNDSELINKAHKIRKHIFVEAQNIPLELDLDGLDKDSYHVLITDDDSLVATARWSLPSEKLGIIARVSVMPSYRGKGISNRLVNSLIEKSKELNLDSVELHAHEYLKKYYESFEFTYIKDVEVVGEHQLIEMSLKL